MGSKQGPFPWRSILALLSAAVLTVCAAAWLLYVAVDPSVSW
jgi:hypothetical protein